MSVKDALDQIVSRHQDVIGAMVLANGDVHHNLEAPYDVISADLVLNTLSEIFEQTSILADEGHDFSELMIDFSNHSLIVRNIDAGVLAVVAPSMQRGQLIKLQVGLGIFAKSVQKAIDESNKPPAPSTPDIEEDTSRIPSQPAVVLADPHAVSEVPLPPADDESSLGRDVRQKNGRFSRASAMLANRLHSTPSATSEPVFKEAEPEPENAVSEDGVPLRPDGTPMKKKMYRGQVYYE